MPPTESIIHHPFAFQWGAFQVTGFGLAVLLAFGIADVIARRELERRGHDPEPIGDLIFAAIIGGLLGAKLYYVIVIARDIHELFTRAGFVFWGGLIGGILAVAAVIHYKKLRFTRISDVGAIAVAAAYSIGRSGCWAVGDDYGRPWSSRWAVSFPNGAPPSTAQNMQQIFGVAIPPGTPPEAVLSVYPTQLYEVTLGFLMFLILWRFRDHEHAEGWLFGFYCVLAGVERFIIEFFRAKDDRFFAGLTAAQMIALAFAVGGAVWMYLRRNRGPNAPGIYAPDVARAAA
jgi:phosphatidylglycerol:prolipoprotein diacylglycerol transferase